MKKVSIVIPVYNEQENVLYAYEKIMRILAAFTDRYQFDIVYLDNGSIDRSKEIILTLCENDKNVKAIFNSRNFGFSRSTFHGLTQLECDCAILIFCDMQDPPEMIPKFLEEWENGYRIVCGVKNKSKENKIIYLLRGMYYKFIKVTSEIEHISQFTGFGLYDRSFLDVMKKLDDPVPYLRGIVAELGSKRKDLFYEQVNRKYGKSNFNFFRAYDVAMQGITSYSKYVMRFATIIGFFMSILSLLVAVISLILKILNWDYFPIGIAVLVVGVFFLGSTILFFVGLLGEYILTISERTMHRPLVIEEKRINFHED